MPPPRPVANMADVARRAGVGMATVSRALSGAPGVSAKTRKRVLEVADEIGYVVSPEASSLARGVTQRVAVVVPHLSRWFFSTIVAAIESDLRSADLDLLIYQVPNAASRHSFFERLPARRKVDAVIVVGIPVDEREQRRLESMGVEIVAVGGDAAAFPFVTVDDEAAGRLATEFLLRLGHVRVGMIVGTDPEVQSWPVRGAGRTDGYRAAFAEAGLPVDERLIVYTPWSGEGGATAMATLLSLPDPPTAVFAHADEIAVGAMRTIRRAGLRVPEDVSIIGIDDDPIAALTDLTTIAQPVEAQGAAVAELLLARLRGRPSVDRVIMPTRLVPRGSTMRLEPAARPLRREPAAPDADAGEQR